MAITNTQRSGFAWLILIVVVLTLVFAVFSTIFIESRIDSLGMPIKELKPAVASNSGKISLYVPPLPDSEGATVKLIVR